MKRFADFLIIPCLILSLTLCGCANFRIGKESTDSPSIVSDTDSGDVQPSIGVGEDELSFGLTMDESPSFRDVSDTTSVGDDESSSVVMPELSEMYTERDGYAYLLDPATLELVGGPLDVVTHEPVDVTPTTSTETPQEVQQESPSREAPTEDTKYPNTGIFFEDD